jgi:aspartate/methionine/tyrosine aminotransferase
MIENSPTLMLYNYRHQGAIPHIMKNTNDEFFRKTLELLKETAEICFGEIKEIKCITCPHKPEGSFFMMVRQSQKIINISYSINADHMFFR